MIELLAMTVPVALALLVLFPWLLWRSRKPKRNPNRPFPRPSEKDPDFWKKHSIRQFDRTLDLALRVVELEHENKRLAFRLRCAESLISVRALRGDLEVDGKACDEGMGG